MSLLQQKLQGAVDFLLNLAWLRGWRWTTSLQDLKWGLSTLMTPSRYERWKLCLERTYLVYDQEYRKRLRVASRHTSIIRVHCQVVFVIEWSLIHNNNIHEKEVSIRFVSLRRSVCEWTARSFSESVLVSFGDLRLYLLPWSEYDYRSGKWRLLPGYSSVSPASTGCYAHISLSTSLDRHVSESLYSTALLIATDS